MSVFVPIPWMHVTGRFLLSMDIFFFFMRTFEMLMVFDELGLLLVMVYKMVSSHVNGSNKPYVCMYVGVQLGDRCCCWHGLDVSCACNWFSGWLGCFFGVCAPYSF